MVSLYHALGVRQMLFAYNRNNAAGGGCHDDDVGLTEFGRAVIGEMNRVGMLVDCSHSAIARRFEAMAASNRPGDLLAFQPARPVGSRDVTSATTRSGLCRHGGIIGINGSYLLARTTPGPSGWPITSTMSRAGRAAPCRIGLD